MMCIAGCLHGSASALALCCPPAMCCALHLASVTPCTLGTPPHSLAGCFPFPTISWKHTQAKLGARCHKATLR